VGWVYGLAVATYNLIEAPEGDVENLGVGQSTPCPDPEPPPEGEPAIVVVSPAEGSEVGRDAVFVLRVTNTFPLAAWALWAEWDGSTAELVCYVESDAATFRGAYDTQGSELTTDHDAPTSYEWTLTIARESDWPLGTLRFRTVLADTTGEAV
jgi:hypothetical protein